MGSPSHFPTICHHLRDRPEHRQTLTVSPTSSSSSINRRPFPVPFLMRAWTMNARHSDAFDHLGVNRTCTCWSNFGGIGMDTDGIVRATQEE